jgi:multidrug efflux system membrane fusion protein
MQIHRFRLSVPLFAIALSFAACSSNHEGAANGAAAGARRGPAEAVPVLAAYVEQKAMPVTLPAVGTVEAIASVEVRSQVTGQLSAVHFTEGQEVEKGQLLFTLDSRPFQATVQQAEAVLARDTATFKNSEAQQARVENLFQRGLIARDQYESGRANTQALAAVLEADKATLENAKLNLQYAEIKAPVSGRTGALGVHAGDLIRANDMTPLVVINQLSPAYVAFSVPGRYLQQIRNYQAQKPLRVAATASPDAPSREPAARPSNGTAPAPATGAAAAPFVNHGSVSFIDNMVDPTTGTIRLKATFQNADRQLWPGAFVQVTLDLTTDANALVVPATAVQPSQDGQYVYVVKQDGTVEMRPVKVDRQQGSETVIAEGLSRGEKVITDGHLRLTPGARVAERNPASTH